MTTETYFCFVVMPFKPQLKFLYRYLQLYLKTNHELEVERGDHDVLTIPLIDKITDQIDRADLIIGDISGLNPNVFYELGIAHAKRIPMILMTSDKLDSVPTDLKGHEFIVYDMEHPDELVCKLDNAIKNMFEGKYQIYYKDAEELLKKFNAYYKSSYSKVSRDEFKTRIRRDQAIQRIPNQKDGYAYAAFLLPNILENPSSREVMRCVKDWLNQKFSDKR
jgi:hypothetical protein